MKKIISSLLAIFMILTVATVAVAAVDYDQPIERGTYGVSEYRIPALYTLENGAVISLADMRYDHGADSPNNIEILAAVSPNGYTDWKYTVLNHFDDYADGVTATASASFIDSAVVQSSTGRIFVISDAQPAGCGYSKCERGSGFITVDGKPHMLLTTGNSTDEMSSFDYYIGDFTNGYAPVLKVADNSVTEYSVDAELNLYKNGAPMTMKQRGSEGVVVHQNVFYADAALKCFCTTYLWMRYSDDNGATWSSPVILTGQVKTDNEYFLGICPGRGIVTTLDDGTERIIFTVYDNGNIGWNAVENVSTIYSDDNGVTWKRGAETIPAMGVGKTSESQIVDLGGGTLRMFARNSSNYIAYADSTDYGVSWGDFIADENLNAMGNCMCSFINTSKTIGGKKVILGSFASNPASRADGVIKVGLVNANKTIDWVSTYKLTQGSFFAYSCMTELADGNFGILYEDEASHIEYLVFSVDENGNISEVNGNDPVTETVEKELTVWEKIVKFFNDLIFKIQKFLGFI
ncbi:MAG: exo-alpha-sialidase [Clostridia bacterium]|nr:exo-alpha-sialidase [Clostridia bacterium]